MVNIDVRSGLETCSVKIEFAIKASEEQSNSQQCGTSLI